MRFTLAALTLVLVDPARAHDVPATASVHAFVKPSGAKLQLLVRVPLRAIRDIEFPERGGYLDLDRLEPMLPDAATLWIGNIVEIREDGSALPKPRVAAARVSLESDRSFASFDEAVAHMAAPRLATSAGLVWNQVWFDALLEYPMRSERSRFSIRPRFERFGARVVTAMRYVLPEGTVRAFEFTGDPGWIALDPGWFEASRRFVEAGFFHILDGLDHLLFLVCLVMPSRRIRELVWLVTAFTAAHSATLLAAAAGLAPDAGWFPPLVETLIAASIVWMALANILGEVSWRRRWIAAFGFGLIHGFGFSFALRETLQFAGTHFAASLLSFNLGVEAGQLAVLAVLVPALDLLFRFAPERAGTIVLSALVAHSGWHWMTERFDALRRYSIEAPEMDAASLARLLSVLAWLCFGAGLAWLAWRRAAVSRNPVRTEVEEHHAAVSRDPAAERETR